MTSPSALAQLKRLRPWLYADLMRRVPAAIPEYLLDPLAQYLEWKTARRALPPLLATPHRRLVCAGLNSLTERLLASPLLDEHELAAVIARDSRKAVFSPGHGFVPIVAPERAAEVRADGVIITDPDMSWLAGTLGQAVTLQSHDDCRRQRYFPDHLRQAAPEPFQRLATKAWRSLEAALVPDKTILFAGVWAYFNFSRMSLSLRRRGFKTAFLCLNPSNTQHRDNQFDAVADAGGDVELFFTLIRTYPCAAVHFQGWCTNHCFAAAAAELATCPLVVELNDVPQYLLEPSAFDDVFGEGIYAMEERAIGHILDKARAVVFNTVQGGSRPLLERYGRSPRVLHFNSYPTPDFFVPERTVRKPGPIRLAFAGLVNASHLPESVFGDVKLIRLISRLTAQGLQFHLYPNPYQSIDAQGPLQDYAYLAKRDANLVLHQGIAPREIVMALSGMDYGSMLYLFPAGFEIKREHLSMIVPTKLFTYLEAGLPVLVSPELEGVARLVADHGMGLVVDEADLDTLGERLRSADWRAMHRNVLAYREANSMDLHAERLLDLYMGARS